MVGNADDVAGPGFLGQLSVAGLEQDRVVDGHGLARAHVVQLHTALELAAAHAEEGDAVPVFGIHVRLDLEHEARHLFFAGLDRSVGGLGARRRRQLGHAVEQLAHAEVVQRAAKEHRCERAGLEGLQVELGAQAAHGLDFVAQGLGLTID